MKKILIATLALITALCISLAACDKNDKNKNDDPADDDDDIVARPNDDDSNSTDTTGNGNGNTGTNVWVDKNDTVYVLTESNIRANTSTSSTKIATVPMGTALTRVQTNGTWDKITYNDQEAYIKSNLVTTNVNTVTFDPVTDQIFLHLKTSGNSANPTSVNLRKSPTSTSGVDPVCTITETTTSTDVLKLIAKSRDGSWVKVSFTGTVGGTTYTGTEELYCTPGYFIELQSGSQGGNNDAAG